MGYAGFEQHAVEIVIDTGEEVVYAAVKIDVDLTGPDIFDQVHYGCGLPALGMSLHRAESIVEVPVAWKWTDVDTAAHAAGVAEHNRDDGKRDRALRGLPCSDP